MKRIRSPAELCAHAIAIEREAALRYGELAERMEQEGREDLAHVFACLAPVEAEHLEALERRTEGVALPGIADQGYRWYPGGAPESAARHGSGGAGACRAPHPHARDHPGAARCDAGLRQGVTMYRHVLVPTDGSPTAEKAVAAGIDYARETGARMLFFTAVHEYVVPAQAELMARRGVPLHEYERHAAQLAREVLDRVAMRAKEANIAFDTEYALSDHPAAAIVEAARRHGCDAIFMATHGRTGWSAFVYGSETHDVLVNSDIPTLVYR